jgi:hypothetical protein
MALKLGAEDKKKVYIAGGLGFVVLILAARMLLGNGDTPPAAAAPPVVTTTPGPGSTTGTAGARAATKVATAVTSLDPTLHPELMAQAESLEYTGNGRNIFSLNSAPIEIPKQIASVRQQEQSQVPTGPPPPAPPPPIDLKFYGYTAVKSGLRRACLLKGDDIFLAYEGDVVDHRYKVVKIAPLSVQVEDIPYSNTQSLPLVQN